MHPKMYHLVWEVIIFDQYQNIDSNLNKYGLDYFIIDMNVMLLA